MSGSKPYPFQYHIRNGHDAQRSGGRRGIFLMLRLMDGAGYFQQTRSLPAPFMLHGQNAYRLVSGEMRIRATVAEPVRIAARLDVLALQIQRLMLELEGFSIFTEVKRHEG